MADNVETANTEKSQVDFKEITSYIFEELSKRNLLRKGTSTYQNTESLLYKYNDLKKSIEDNGGKVASSISSKTTYVIAGDNMGPSKLAKAESLGIPIISEFDYLKFIE